MSKDVEETRINRERERLCFCRGNGCIGWAGKYGVGVGKAPL